MASYLGYLTDSPRVNSKANCSDCLKVKSLGYC
jgi:hypothetical protein